MTYYLFLISLSFIIIGFLGYIFIYLLYMYKNISNNSSFYICKDFLSDYNTINIIKTNNFFSYYQIKRKVIKLNSKTYDSNCLSQIVFSLISSSIAHLDYKNKFINKCRYIINNLEVLYLLYR